MLVKTIDTASELRQEFVKYDRDYYSFEFYKAVMDYFDDVSNEPTELDVIAICCDFNEMTVNEIINDYNIEIEENEDKKEAVENYLSMNTWYQETEDNKFIFIAF
jgi:hypothetical protein